MSCWLLRTCSAGDAFLQAAKLPYRDINLKVTNDAYTFTSPSSPDAPALVLDRPTGDARLSENALASTKRASRATSVAGILGIIQLRLGMFLFSPVLLPSSWTLTKGRQ